MTLSYIKQMSDVFSFTNNRFMYLHAESTCKEAAILCHRISTVAQNAICDILLNCTHLTVNFHVVRVLYFDSVKHLIILK